MSTNDHNGSIDANEVSQRVKDSSIELRIENSPISTGNSSFHRTGIAFPAVLPWPASDRSFSIDEAKVLVILLAATSDGLQRGKELGATDEDTASISVRQHRCQVSITSLHFYVESLSSHVLIQAELHHRLDSLSNSSEMPSRQKRGQLHFGATAGFDSLTIGPICQLGGIRRRQSTQVRRFQQIVSAAYFWVVTRTTVSRDLLRGHAVYEDATCSSLTTVIHAALELQNRSAIVIPVGVPFVITLPSAIPSLSPPLQPVSAVVRTHTSRLSVFRLASSARFLFPLVTAETFPAPSAQVMAYESDAFAFCQSTKNSA
ncbi:uncharacterized protein BCR38DRAFT_412854 [Pseudomassariella vexata]|uniref:Uncharacterized protein n=1 Tax=Pseudomassariella vexata TaxID=1141098 RepID=A0A1Y2DIT9_9PEZI|nr:uncharacterized protein BCR38DRAFT_412854 [Pseudomassariella vexata]ORY59141.1 hypothetical protein BCR38DRAFT_412854 [Pseudomassariella vexata]